MRQKSKLYFAKYKVDFEYIIVNLSKYANLLEKLNVYLNYIVTFYVKNVINNVKYYQLKILLFYF